MKRTLHIMVGLPGSGKTHITKSIGERGSWMGPIILREESNTSRESRLNYILKSIEIMSPNRDNVIDVLIENQASLLAVIAKSKEVNPDMLVKVHIVKPSIEDSLFNDEIRGRGTSAKGTIISMNENWNFDEKIIKSAGASIEKHKTYQNEARQYAKSFENISLLNGMSGNCIVVREHVNGYSNELIPSRLISIAESVLGDTLSFREFYSILESVVDIDTDTEYGYYESRDDYVVYSLNVANLIAIASRR